MTTNPTILRQEKQADFDILAASIRAEFSPSGDFETFLIDQMIAARWRLARFERLEVIAFDVILDPTTVAATPDALLVAHFNKKGDALSFIQRQVEAAARVVLRCHRELQHARKQNAAFQNQAMDNFVQNYLATPAQSVAPKNGFASQNAPQSPVAKKTGVADSLGNLALRL